MSQFFKKTLTAAAIVAALGSGTAFGQDPKAAKPAAAPAAAPAAPPWAGCRSCPEGGAGTCAEAVPGL